MEINKQKIKLRPYQIKAIGKWKEKNYRGILSMATGTGKTIIAIKCITPFLKEGNIGLIIVPTKALLKQWYGVIKDIFPRAIVVRCGSDDVGWNKKLENLVKLHLLQSDSEKSSFIKQKLIISTMGTAWKKDFKEHLKGMPLDDVVVIVDEVHRVGAPRYRNILTLPFNKRLGLSATPIREWDYIGTKRIKNYFGGIIYSYTISDAIEDRYLAPYEYYVEPVSLTLDEAKQYLEISENIKKITKVILRKYPGYSIKDLLSVAEELGEKDEELIISLQGLLVNRRRIIKKCKNKYKAIMKIIKEHSDKIQSCLVYCEDYKQLDTLKKLMLEEGISVGEYTARLNSDERELSFNAIRNGHIRFLLSCKCLDEGVDIPVCEAAILMANSTVEREFIQRRGRILRLHPSKKNAIIFDLFVVPFKDAQNEVPLNEVEKRIIQSELERIRFFAEDATNKEEIIKKLNIIGNVFKLKHHGGE